MAAPSTVSPSRASQGAPVGEDKAPMDPELGKVLSAGTFPGLSAQQTDICTYFHYIHHSEGDSFDECSILLCPRFLSWSIHRSAPSQTQLAAQLQQLVHLLLLYECLWIRCEHGPMRWM